MKGKKTNEGRRGQAIQAFLNAGANGLTTDELEEIGGIPRNSGSGRLAELRKLGIIRASGKKRLSKKGKLANVWVLVNPGEIPDVITPEAKHLPKVPNSAKIFWRELRRQVMVFTKQAYPDVDEGSWTQYARELDADLRGIVSHFINKMGRAQTAGTVNDVIISRRRMIDACETLRVPPPGTGQPADLEVAKRNKRHASRLYHPDTGSGNETTRALFQAAIEAYDVLEQYNQSLRSNPNGR